MWSTVLTVLAIAADGLAGGTPVAAHDVVEREPYLGVACRTPNSIACDRVGLALWLATPAARVTATIGGRTFALDDETWSDPRGDLHIGYLRRAGLSGTGPLGVTPDEPPERLVRADAARPLVHLRITRRDGRTETTRVRVGLHPGWG